MRAAVIAAPRRLDVVETAVPEPDHGQALVRIDGCGICGSDLAVWQGQPWFEYPLSPGRPGHEAWGTVAAVGDGVALRPGQRVTGLLEGGFADYGVADASSVVPLPDTVDGPFPGEAIGCGLNIFARSGIRGGDTVAVVGIGFLGGLLVQLAVQCGARVVALSRREYALQTATACGAAETLPLGHEDPAAAVAALTGGALCDVVIEATGRQSALDVASSLVRVRGRLVIAGYHQDGPRTVDMQSWNWRGLDVVNAHERDPKVYVGGIRRGVDAVAQGRLDLRPLITHPLPLARLDTALDLALERPDGFVKAVVQR